MSPVDRFLNRLVYLQKLRGIGKLASLILQLFGVYLPRVVPVGTELCLPHATTGLVVHYRTRIGDRVSIYHNVTIGRADGYEPVEHPPIPGCELQDDVVLCAGSVILPGRDEELVIGRGAVVGANSVVTGSIPPGEIWAGNPAKFIRVREGYEAVTSR
jgi:serine O-acetyltransferase